MSGPLGTSGGGAAGVTSVTAGNGITVTGTTTPTIAASLAAGTGIGISGTTTLTVSATGVNSVSGGTGISVSGSTSLTITNSGVTSLAGTGVSVSASTGAVTVTPTYAAPTALTIGGTVVTGAAASVANSAHVHAMPGSAVAGASAVGDTAATGSATTVALSDHRHSREAFGTPIAVTGGATAASGSATTIARSDHVHSTASMPVLLGTTTLASAAASIVLSSIPQTYKTLQVVFQGRAAVAVTLTGVMVQFNGDTSSIYDNGFGANRNNLHLGFITGSTTYWSAATGIGIMWIQDYAQTTFYKSTFSSGGSSNNSGSTYSHAGMSTHGQWRSTVAITSITLTVESGGNFVSGSSVTLYGYP